MDTSMMAWRVQQFGPPEAMIFESVARPVPGPGEVLVKIYAAGVGLWDGLIRSGKSVLPQPLPLTLGSDFSGDIQTVGIGVSDLQIGDPVYGVTNPRFIGAYAQYAVASAAMIARKPTSLSYIEAASVPVIAVTAWQGLFDQAQLKAGQTVVIHGAAGNVGAYAVQLAHRAGIRIIATAATDEIKFVRELGADTVIDFRTQRFEDAAHNVDAVLDLVGGEMQRRSPEALSSAAGMRAAHRSYRFILLLWSGIAMGAAIAIAAGYVAFGSLGDVWPPRLQAFGAGALLAMTAETMIPEAFHNSPRFSGLLAAVGFGLLLLVDATTP